MVLHAFMFSSLSIVTSEFLHTSSFLNRISEKTMFYGLNNSRSSWRSFSTIGSTSASVSCLLKSEKAMLTYRYGKEKQLVR